MLEAEEQRGRFAATAADLKLALSGLQASLGICSCGSEGCSDACFLRRALSACRHVGVQGWGKDGLCSLWSVVHCCCCQQ